MPIAIRERIYLLCRHCIAWRVFSILATRDRLSFCNFPLFDEKVRYLPNVAMGVRSTRWQGVTLCLAVFWQLPLYR